MSEVLEGLVNASDILEFCSFVVNNRIIVHVTVTNNIIIHCVRKQGQAVMHSQSLCLGESLG